MTPATAGVLAAGLVLATGGAVSPASETAADIGPPPTPAAISAGQPGPIRVMVVGDSVANNLAPGLVRAGPRQGLTVWDATIPGCGITQDVGEQHVWTWDRAGPGCSPGWRQRWPVQVSEFNPDVVVVLLGTDDAFDRRIDGRIIPFDSAAGDLLTRSELQEAITILSSNGARVVALTTPYSPPYMTLPRIGTLDRSCYNPRWIDRWNGHLRALAIQNPSTVTIVDLNQFLDPGGEWTGTVNGVNVRGTDSMHVSPEGADLVAGWLGPQLVRLARAPAPTANASVGGPVGVPAGVAAR